MKYFSFWSNLIQSRPYTYSTSWKKALFLHFNVYFDHLFDNHKFGKEIIVLEKSLEKVLSYRSRNLSEPWELDTMCQQHVWYVKINIKFCSSTFKSASCWLACASPSDSRDFAKSRSSENWVCMIWETDQI